MRRIRVISCLAVAALAVAMTGAAGSAATPTVSATPNTGLADGQQVSVSASGFAANTEMAVVECPTATVTPADCDLSTVALANTDATGSYSAFPFTVSRILSDGTDCALNGGCYIGTQDSAAVGATAATLIQFDPNIPPLPKLELSTRWDKTPNVNSKGVVAIKGSVHCKNKASIVEVDVDLRQIVHRAIFESFGIVDLACAADTTVPFRITVRPQNGLFGPGPANLRFVAFSLTSSTAVSGSRNLTLQGTGTAVATQAIHSTWR